MHEGQACRVVRGDGWQKYPRARLRGGLLPGLGVPRVAHAGEIEVPHSMDAFREEGLPTSLLQTGRSALEGGSLDSRGS